MKLPAYARLLITLAAVGVIVGLSVTPGDDPSADGVFVWLVVVTPPTLQKIMHMVAYAGLAILWMWTFETFPSRRLGIALSLTITVAIGAILEWYQTMVPGRFGSLMDIVLDALGALLGILVAVFIF